MEEGCSHEILLCTSQHTYTVFRVVEPHIYKNLELLNMKLSI